MRGELVLIGTPIGNLGDLTPRARETLLGLHVLYCEDTRVTGKLLSHLGIKLPLRALSDDQPQARVDEAVAAIKAGQRLGFVTDAGMPGVSDPGRRLTRAVWDAGYTPSVIPGPSSVGTALAACPFVYNRFRFIGFPPRKTNDRLAFIEQLVVSTEPCFFFESPHRVHGLLNELCATLEPQRELLIGREMTKLHEQLELFHAEDWPSLCGCIPEMGEYTVAVAGRAASDTPPVHDAEDQSAALKRLLNAGFSKRDAVKALATIWEVSPNDLKKLLY